MGVCQVLQCTNNAVIEKRVCHELVITVGEFGANDEGDGHT